MARSIGQILTAAATAPDGSVPAKAGFIVETALTGLGVSARARKRLLAGPRPGQVSDLGACPLPEPLLSTVAVIAFSAMAEAEGPTRRSGRRLRCCAGWASARPAAEAKAREIPAEYNSTYLVLSDLAKRLRPDTPQRPRRLRPPVARLAAVGAAVHQRNPNEVNRQATRQAAVALLRYGTRATVAQARRCIRPYGPRPGLVGKSLGEETRAVRRSRAGAQARNGRVRTARLPARAAAVPR